MPRKTGYKNVSQQRRSKCKLCGSFVDVKDEKKDNQTVKDIPGYFFDTEKKRYFKITNETRNNFKALKKKRGPIFCDNCKAFKAIQEKKRKKSSIVKDFIYQQYKQVSPWNLRRSFIERLACSYQVKQKIGIELTHLDPCEFAVVQIQADLNFQKVLMLHQTLSADDQIVQFHKVQKESKTTIRLVPGMDMMKKEAVTSLHWSPHQKTSEFFIISLLGCDGKWGEGMLFHTDGEMQTFKSRFPMNQHSVWTSAWCGNPMYDNIISMGASKMALTFDVNTRRRMLRFLAQTDVFAQEFATQSPVLFNGFRNGEIKSSDFRLTGTHVPCSFLKANNRPITWLKLLQEEAYLLASGMDDKIRLWDLRMTKIVQEYHGHCNTTTRGLSVCLDPSESLLFAAGEDSTTRVWNVSTGEMVHSIKFPDNEKSTLSSIPAISYSNQWGGPGGLPGLLYGTNQFLRWYAT